MEFNLKHWNDLHQLLRRLLLKDKDYQRAIPAFREHHAAAHAAELQAGAHWSWHDEVLTGLTPEQMRYTPKGSPHSVAWRIWHMARRPAPDRLLRLVAEHAVEQSTLWLLGYWGGHPAANLLLMPATRHSFLHLNAVHVFPPKCKPLPGSA